MVSQVMVSSNRLRVLRAEKRVTQMNVAKRVLGISNFRYWQIEHGYLYPRVREIRRLARFFGVDARVIFSHLTEGWDALEPEVEPKVEPKVATP